MTQKLPSTENRSGALDLLRFLAISVVFFGHYVEAFNYANQIVPANLKFIPLFRYGCTSIIVFYMVSGYTVTMTSMKRGLKDFFIIRLSRLYPLFWVSCLAAFILQRFVSDHTYLPGTSIKILLANLTMMPGLFGYPLINPVFHTLLIELTFYFLIGFIILFKLWKKLIYVITFLLIFCLADAIFLTKIAYVFFTPFIAGMLFFLINIGYDKPIKLYSLLAVNYVCSLMSAIPLSGPFKNISTTPHEYDKWFFMVVLTLIYIVFLLTTGKKIVIKSNPVIQTLGKVVYPLYLFHLYFLYLYWYFSDTIQPQVLLISLFLLAIMVSWALHVLVEKPFSKFTYNTLVWVTDSIKIKKLFYKLKRFAKPSTYYRSA
ncbi:acyltransferase family protein [Larkinella sp. VNQ87]|uniref:acyltransferase family protein n=1 Tax=Larkinella sp. VNQ87 TaxID=3400921 RepID=UPI003C092809